MLADLGPQIAALNEMSVAMLRDRYAELFGEPTRVGHKAWLVKRIAWRLQALAEGDLSERARRRADELAHDADLRLSAPKRLVAEPAATTAAIPAARPARRHDDRLPLPGTVLNRRYKGRDLEVHVRHHGFELDGTLYPSLSALAKAVTGSHCNGVHFFRLGRHGGGA